LPVLETLLSGLVLLGAAGLAHAGEDDFPGANVIYRAYGVAEPGDDWIARDFESGTSMQKPLPLHGFSVHETTPHFHWPWHADMATYTLEIADLSTGEVVLSQAVGTNRNWYRLSESQQLVPGRWYAWRVDAGSGRWSSYRHFGIAIGAIAYTVPDALALKRRAETKPHPRIVPTGEEWVNMVTALDPSTGMYGSRTRSVQGELSNYVIGSPHPWEGDGISSDTSSVYELNNMLNLVFMWKLTAASSEPPRPNVYHDEAFSRFADMISPYTGRMPRDCNYANKAGYAAGGKGWVVGKLGVCKGKTTYSVSDQGASEFLLALAVGWDAFHAELTAAQKAQFAVMFGARLNEWLTLPLEVLGRDYARWIENSHGTNHIWHVCLAAALVAGDEAELGSDTPQNGNLASSLDAVLSNENYFPLQLSVFPPFMLEDGGPGRGFGYATTESRLPAMLDMARRIVGVDVLRQPKFRLAQVSWLETTPYGSIPVDPVSFKGYLYLFGDGALSYDRNKGIYGASDVVAALYRRDATAQGLKYLMDYGAFHRTYNTYNLSLWSAVASTIPSQPSGPARRSRLFESTGIFASQSDPDDPARTMAWFISGYFGAYNHNHANQNSFVVSMRGKSLLVDSGYFDAYKSPHWSKWYRQTKAKNAITVNGRAGQQRGVGSPDDTDARANTGFIARYVDHPLYSLAQGNARHAYQMPGFEMARALRTIIHFYPDVIFVIDDYALEKGAYRWEWNFHTLRAPQMTDKRPNSGAVRISDPAKAASVAATVRVVWANDKLSRTVLTDHAWPKEANPLHDEFGNPAPPQWHNRFEFAQASALRSVIMISGSAGQEQVRNLAVAKVGGNSLNMTFEYHGHRFVVQYDFVTGEIRVA
jgi:hypothetical protein